MAYSANPYAAYNHANETKSPAEQILILYSAAISFVQQAKQAAEAGEHNERFQLIERTIAIVRGLRACLDYDANCEVANALNDYYKDLEILLVAIQGEDNKEEICDKVVDNLRVIKTTWEKANPEYADSVLQDEDDDEEIFSLPQQQQEQEEIDPKHQDLSI